MIEQPLLVPGDVERLLAERIRAARSSRGWSQQDLATRAGLGIATVARLERSGRGQLTTLIRIAAALGRLRDFDALLATEAPRSLDELRKLRGDR